MNIFKIFRNILKDIYDATINFLILSEEGDGLAGMLFWTITLSIIIPYIHMPEWLHFSKDESPIFIHVVSSGILFTLILGIALIYCLLGSIVKEYIYHYNRKFSDY